MVVVFRTFPIRVAGKQAGPLSDELTWEQLQAESHSPVRLEEYTSVTHKLRRLGRFDLDAARRAVSLNRPTKIAINFLDYIDYMNRGVTQWSRLSPAGKQFVETIESRCGAPAEFLGTGPRLSDNVLHLRDSVLPEMVHRGALNVA